MKVFRDINNLPEFTNSVITIGSFDGIHHGHQEIVYPKDKSLQLLTSIEEKIKVLDSLGIDNLVIVPFTIEFSQQSADEYIFKFLHEKFSPRYIVIGYDHKFGLNRQGDINYLRAHSEKLRFEVIEISAQQKEDIVISSTKIRNALKEGKVALANRFLQHNYTLGGVVSTGQNIGTKIGYPTANILVTERHKLIPKNGIYAVKVNLEMGSYGGMLYIGNRPTVDDDGHISIEVNIFDFYFNIYGEKIEVELIDWIRGDQKFENLDGLKARLAVDKIESIDILKNKPDLSIPNLT